MTIRKLAILLFVTIVLASSCQTVDTAPDYSDPSYWAYYGEGNADGVDLFMVCPCVDMGGDGRLNMMLSDEDAKASFVGALNMERGIYDEVAIMYAPFSSRTSSFSVSAPYCCTCFTAGLFVITSSTQAMPPCVRIDSRQKVREQFSSVWCRLLLG